MRNPEFCSHLSLEEIQMTPLTFSQNINEKNPESLLVSVLYALGDPIRLSIVRQLANYGDMACSDLRCNISRSTLSHHLRILKESGLVECRKSGTSRIQSLRYRDVETMFPGLIETILQVTDRYIPQASRSLSYDSSQRVS